MMHNREHGFVIAVLCNGKVLREDKGKVFVPFGSEYVIRIKNPNHYRVGVTVDVDGSEINTSKIVIDANSSVDIKRMCLDGDLNSGPALKFVELGHGDVQDPTNTENGIIKVTFYKEYTPFSYQGYKSVNNLDLFSKKITFRDSSGDASWMNDLTRSVSGSTLIGGAAFNKGIESYGSASVDTQYSANVSGGLPGATVPGEKTEQQYTTVDISFETWPIAVMTLRMRGHEQPVFTQDPKPSTCFCTNCGSKMLIRDNYCAKCGTVNKAQSHTVIR